MSAARELQPDYSFPANDGAQPAPVEVRVGDRVTLVSPEDAGWVNEWTWHLDGKGYVKRTVRLTPGRKGKKTSVFLHRLVTKARTGQIVDHIDGNPLNNQRGNLRLATALENARNVTSSKNRKAGKFKGVYFIKKSGKWGAAIGAGEKKPNGKARMLYQGCYDTQEEAARAYDAAARRYFGPYAATNFAPAEDIAWVVESVTALEGGAK